VNDDSQNWNQLVSNGHGFGADLALGNGLRGAAKPACRYCHAYACPAGAHASASHAHTCLADTHARGSDADARAPDCGT
jgi:hypothetical protein